jgi:hypothetical protein
LATTTPNKATKKRTESDANLVNCMMMIEEGKGMEVDWMWERCRKGR